MFTKKDSNGAVMKNVDLLSVMQEIVDKNTQSFKSDFQIDRKTLQTAAEMVKQGAKKLHYIWITRKCGTWLLEEPRVMISGSAENSTLLYYEDMGDENPHVTAITITGKEGDHPVGEIYSMKYTDYCDYIKAHGVPIDGYEASYEKGSMRVKKMAYIVSEDSELGKLKSISPMPNDMAMLEEQLAKVKQERQGYAKKTREAFVRAATN